VESRISKFFESAAVIVRIEQRVHPFIHSSNTQKTYTDMTYTNRQTSPPPPPPLLSYAKKHPRPTHAYKKTKSIISFEAKTLKRK
jgi:hypothetical protein